ncbi:41306_t:CDS:2, partial [Gigaspora margarita]
EDDPLYSGIIDLENIENQKSCLFQKLSKLTWLDDNENEIERDEKQLVHDFKPQSLLAKDHGARKFGDIIGYFTGSDKNLYELFFVEVSYGPFHQEPEDHIDNDRKKLGKL